MATIIYGECIAPRASAPVRISELAHYGCDLETDGLTGVTDGNVTLWIGAMVPFPAQAMRKDACHLTLRFTEPLDCRILQHFRG